MICPHCGRNTNAADTCQHCHKPTEFTTRFNSRPGPIPGIEDNPVSPPVAHTPVKKAGTAPSGVMYFCVAASLIACALSILCLLQIIRLSNKETIPPVSVPETTSVPVAECVVTFDWNLQEINEWIPPIAKGETLPTLRDREEYLFTGWNTDRNGYGTSFHPGEIFDLELKQDLTLFAQWEPAPVQTEPTEPETEATNAEQEVDSSDVSELEPREADPSDASVPDPQDSNTQASASDLSSTRESEEYYG